jgi:hypothetical protein
MTEIPIEQALFHRPDREGPRLLARSAGFRDDWLAEAEGLIMGFGDRPPGVACAHAVYAQPIGDNQVAIVHMADQPARADGRAVAGFHFLVLSRFAYAGFLGDPFALAARLEATWDSRDVLPACRLPAQPLQPRTVAEVQQVLRRVKSGALPEDADPNDELERTPENSESPALLGGVQALVDGGRVVFERPAADTGLIPSLWALLPTSTRSQLWPASFAFGNALGFDALVVPRADGPDYHGYINEDQAAEYPQGHYELAVQTAAEAGDQAALDALFNRRSYAEAWRLGLTLLILFLFLALAARILL